MNLKTQLSGKESTKMMEHITLALTIIIVVHIAMHMTDEDVEFLDEKVIRLSLYIIIGIVAYHMITKKLIYSIQN